MKFPVCSCMIAPITRIDFGDPTELVPAYLTIALIGFLCNNLRLLPL